MVYLNLNKWFMIFLPKAADHLSITCNDKKVLLAKQITRQYQKLRHLLE